MDAWRMMPRSVGGAGYLLCVHHLGFCYFREKSTAVIYIYIYYTEQDYGAPVFTRGCRCSLSCGGVTERLFPQQQIAGLCILRTRPKESVASAQGSRPKLYCLSKFCVHVRKERESADKACVTLRHGRESHQGTLAPCIYSSPSPKINPICSSSSKCTHPYHRPSRPSNSAASPSSRRARSP